MTAVQVYTDELVINVRGGDNPDAGSGLNSAGTANLVACTTAADGWVVNPPSGRTFDRGLMFRLTVTTAATIVFKGGDRPPAHRADLGDLSITMAANDSRMICIETSRFLQNDGTILLTGTNTTDCVGAYMCPIAG